MPKEMNYQTRFRFLYSDLKIFETVKVPDKLKELHLAVFRARLSSLQTEDNLKKWAAEPASDDPEVAKGYKERVRLAQEQLAKDKALVLNTAASVAAEALKVDKSSAFQFSGKRLVTLDGKEEDVVDPIKFGFVKDTVCEVVHPYFSLEMAKNSETDKNLIVQNAAIMKLFLAQDNDLYERHHSLALPPTQLSHYVSQGPCHNFPVLAYLFFDSPGAQNALVLDEEAYYSYSEVHQYILFLAQKRGFKTVSYAESKLDGKMAYEPHVLYFNNKISLDNRKPVVLPAVGGAEPDPTGPPPKPPTPPPEPAVPPTPTPAPPTPTPAPPTPTPAPPTPPGQTPSGQTGSIQYFLVRSTSPVNVPVDSKSIFLHYSDKKAHDFCKLYIEKQTELTGITYPDYNLTTFLANNTNRWELPKDYFYFSYGVNGFSRV
jgi:hypothetical protein